VNMSDKPRIALMFSLDGTDDLTDLQLQWSRIKRIN
jgi:hypothetical protein